MDFEKVQAFYKKVIDAAEELGIIVIAEKIYLIDLQSKGATTLQIMPRPEGESK